MTVKWQNLKVGDELPGLEFGPITRTTLALYAGASGDHNRIHIDIDFARQAGKDDVFAHGMLSMAVLGRLLTQSIPQERLRTYGVRFTAITHLFATVRCSGRVSEISEADGERRAQLELVAETEDGQTLIGWAVVAL